MENVREDTAAINRVAALARPWKPGAYAVGDVSDIKEALLGNLHIRKEYAPDRIKHVFYREQFEKKNRLVKKELAGAFRVLKEMREQGNDTEK